MSLQKRHKHMKFKKYPLNLREQELPCSNLLGCYIFKTGIPLKSLATEALMNTTVIHGEKKSNLRLLPYAVFHFTENFVGMLKVIRTLLATKFFPCILCISVLCDLLVDTDFK